MRRPRVPLLLAGLALLAGCQWLGGPPPAQPVTGGDPEAGRQAIQAFGCGACHVVPGVTGARGTVGPPLAAFAARSYIAGTLPNRPDNLIRWIRDPQGVEPGTIMPDLGVPEPLARDMAAYLYTLR